MKAKYYIDGVGKKAIYTSDFSAKKITREMLETEGEKEDIGFVTAWIELEGDINGSSEAWSVLHGTPSDIVKMIDDYLPLAKAESEKIFNCLNKINDDKVVLLTYVIDDVAPSLRETTVYKNNREAQAMILADLFDLEQSSVFVL